MTVSTASFLQTEAANDTPKTHLIVGLTQQCPCEHLVKRALCVMQGPSADAHLRCKHAVQVWHATDLSLRQQLQDAASKLQLQSKSCVDLKAELSSNKARQADLGRAAQSWQQRALHAEEELKTERHQIARLKTMLPQQNSVMQLQVGGFLFPPFSVCSSIFRCSCT